MRVSLAHTPMNHQQFCLFSSREIPSTTAKTAKLTMSEDGLIAWKRRILNHQQSVRETAAPKQITLFDVAPVHCDADEIDPFTLQLFPLTFHDFANGYAGDACIYFVLDCAAKIVLYIGETKASNLRWDGQHYCKDYVSNYVSLHRQYGSSDKIEPFFPLTKSP